MTFCGSDETTRVVRLASVEEEGRFFHPLLATLTTVARGSCSASPRASPKRRASPGPSATPIPWPSPARRGWTQTSSSARAGGAGWFERLNPYERQTGLFKFEDANFAIEGEGGPIELEPLYCFAVSSKRYALFNIDDDRAPVLRKASAHGLGHLMAPYEAGESPVSILEPQVPLRELGVERWQHDLWQRIVQAALEGHAQQVDFDGLPGLEKKAVSRYAATTPRLARWFKGFNAGRPYREQVRPFGFLNAFLSKKRGQLAEEHRIGGALPRVASPFDDDPDSAVLHCFDRETGEPVAPEMLKSYREVLAQYHLHPEAKFAGGDYVDHGVLRRRHIAVEYVEHIGKEANHWEEQFHLGENPHDQIVYGQSERQQKRLARRVREAIRRRGVRRVARESGLSVGLVSGIMRGERPISERTLRRLCTPRESRHEP